MNRMVLAAIVALVPVTARAETDDVDIPGREVVGDPEAYVASGAIVGNDELGYQGIVLEAGHRLGRTPVFARVMGQAGNVEYFDIPRGTYYEGRIGGEARTCLNAGMLCVSLGVDVGIHRRSYDLTGLDLAAMTAKPHDPAVGQLASGRLDSVIVAPRLTVDGGGRVRIRAVVERPSHTIRGNERIDGVAASLALGLAF